MEVLYGSPVLRLESRLIIGLCVLSRLTKHQSSITFNRCVADSNLLIWAVAMVTDTEFTSREKSGLVFNLITCI